MNKIFWGAMIAICLLVFGAFALFFDAPKGSTIGKVRADIIQATLGQSTLLASNPTSNYRILSVTGNESIMYDVTLNRNTVCLIPKFADTKQVTEEVEDVASVTGDATTKEITTTYTIPTRVPVAVTDNKATTTSEVSKDKDGNFCYDIPAGTRYLKLGKESVVIVGDSFYASQDINVTQETGFAHLNVSTTPPFDKLVLYTPFDINDSGNLITYDYSNNNLDGTLNVVGAGYPTWNASGLYGGAYEFGGISNNYINFGNDQLFNMSNKNFSVSIWLKIQNKSGSSYIINKLTTVSGKKDFGIYVDATVNNLYFGVGTSGSTVITCVKKVQLNQWLMATLTFNGTTVAGYINGSQVCQTSFGTNTRGTGDGNLRLGERSGTSGSAYNGTADNLMIFNVSLTPAQIDALYENTSARFASWGTQLFNDTLVGSANENKLNISVNTTTIKGTNISVKLNSGNYVNLTNGIANNLAFTGDPRWLNITFLYLSDNNSFYTPHLIGNITVNAWRDTGTGDQEYPQFTNYLSNNGTLVGSGLATFNITVTKTNGTVFLQINNQNYTATNYSASPTMFNVSINMVEGTYDYYWGSWGNGTSHLYNISNTKFYTINLTGGADTIPPYFESIPAPANYNYGTTLNEQFTGADNIAIKSYQVNNTNMFNISQSGLLTNKTALGAGVYYVNVSINDTSNNQNSTIYEVTINKFTQALTVSVTPNSNVYYPTETTATGNGCINLPSITCKLYLADVETTNPDIQTFSVGSYIYKYNSTGDSNYTLTEGTTTVIVRLRGSTGEAFTWYDQDESDSNKLLSINTNKSIVAYGEIYANGSAVSPWLYNQTTGGDNRFWKLGNSNAYNAMVAPPTYGTGGDYLVIDPASGLLNWSHATTTGNLLYFFYGNKSSDIIAYDEMYETAPSGTTNNVTTVNNVKSGYTIMNWTTQDGFPSLTYMPTGIHTVKINAWVDTVADSPKLYAEIYKVNKSGQDQLLLGTTAQTPLTTSENSYDLIISIPALSLNITDRMVIKMKLYSSNPATAYQVNLSTQGTTSASYIFPQAPPSIFSFVPYTGSTKNVDLNNKNLTNLQMVGIGVVNPRYNLEVVGTANITSNMIIGSVNPMGLSNAGDGVYINGTGIGIGAYTDKGRMMIYHGSDGSGAKTVYTSIISKLSQSGSTQLNEETAIDFMWYDVLYSGRISGFVEDWNNNRGGLKFYTSSPTGSTLNTVPAVTMSYLNNVGINNTSPTSLLDINGTLTLRAQSDGATMLVFSNVRDWAFQKEGTSASSMLRLRNTVGGNKDFYIDTYGNVQFRSALGTGPLATFNYITGINLNNSLYINSTTARVGIGTPNPQSKLSLGQNLANTVLSVYDDGTYLIGMGIQANQFRLHLDAPTSRFSFLDAPAGNELMTIKGTGNVGIGAGTSIPTHTLELNGTLMIRETDSTQNAMELYGDTFNSYIYQYASGTAYNKFTAFGDNYINPAGNSHFGVFTNVPDYRLTVNGNVSLNNTLYVQSDGRVGIGTANPSTNLSVYPDTDATAIIGKAVVGSIIGVSDYAGFSHFDQRSLSNYALLQFSDGQTFVNAPTGKTINLRINNADIANIGVNGLTVTSGSLNATNTIRQGGCNAGFTRWGMSCIQTNEEGTATVDNARTTCSQKYNASVVDLYNLILAFNQSIISNDAGTELSRNVAIEGSTLTCLYYNGGQPLVTSFGSDLNCPTPMDYRCEYPFGGGK